MARTSRPSQTDLPAAVLHSHCPTAPASVQKSCEAQTGAIVAAPVAIPHCNRKSAQGSLVPARCFSNPPQLPHQRSCEACVARPTLTCPASMTVIYPLDESIPTHARPHKMLENTTARTVCAGAVMRDDICRSHAGNLRPNRVTMPWSVACRLHAAELSAAAPYRCTDPGPGPATMTLSIRSFFPCVCVQCCSTQSIQLRLQTLSLSAQFSTKPLDHNALDLYELTRYPLSLR